ncbi:MAG: NYN domain-containing protein [Muribaculaceae bacterium]|nr:NYN domain-containing protein [Muribaculaceae bacterium]
MASFFTIMKVIFYIDGFNLYYGLKTAKNEDPKWNNAYWIDFVKFFSKFLGPEQELGKVVYFTATPLDPGKAARQSELLNVNKALHPDKFEIVRGRYLSKRLKCPICKNTYPRPEEKKTDVNISVRLLGDCMLDVTDRVVLVSADSDLVPPLQFVLDHFPSKKIRVMFPPTLNCKEISGLMRKNSLKTIFLENNYPKFLDSKLANEVCINGKTYTIPSKWKNRIP